MLHGNFHSDFAVDNVGFPVNQTIFQGFEWYLPGYIDEIVRDPKSGVFKDRTVSHWQRLTFLLPQLKSLGITSMWIPPACKATNPMDNGYGIYDLYDLGEFNWKGGAATKWGTKKDLKTLCAEAQKLDVGIIFDAILNHRAAADGSEEALAVRVDPKKRTKNLDTKPIAVETWTRFNFNARKGKYSQLKYHKAHFSGIDWDAKTRQKGIYKFVGSRPDGSTKDWAQDVATSENGNYDYLMFADVDYNNAEVQEDVKRWGTWLVDELPGIRGIRLDAIKHYSAEFQKGFISHVKQHTDSTNSDFFFVGEYWSADSKFLSRHLDSFGGSLHLFDVKLVYNLHDYSTGRRRDLRNVFSGTLAELRPSRAVTFVTNHDTQECQSLAAPVEPWFIPHAYALILLRQQGVPCVFWGDVYGNGGPRPRLPACGGRLARLLKARQLFAHGQQDDYFSTSRSKPKTPLATNEASCIAWRRYWRHPTHGQVNLVVLVSISWSWKERKCFVGTQSAGQIFTDLMGWSWSGVQIDNDGYGKFPVGPRSISVWTRRDLPGREEIDRMEYPSELALTEEMENLPDEVEESIDHDAERL